MAGKRGKFYAEGLVFGCTECGQCCSFPGGYVHVTEQEASRIAAYLGIDEGEFLERYAELANDGHTLQLRSHDNGECIFLEDNRCTVYPTRPVQCATFPFWPENVKSAYRWKITAKSCPGIDQGRHYPAEEIEGILKRFREGG